MKKSEIFDTLLSEVCDVCEVPEELVINGSRIQSVVDARILMVQYARRIGLSNDEIALIVMRKSSGNPMLCPSESEIKTKAKGIDKIFRSYSDRCLQSYAFCLMSADIKKVCRDKYEDIYLVGMKPLPPK